MTDTDDTVRWLVLHKGEFKGIGKRGKKDVYQLGMLIGNLEKWIYKSCKYDQGQRTGTKSSTVMYDVNRQLLMSISNLRNFTGENICEDLEEYIEFFDGEQRALKQNDK